MFRRWQLIALVVLSISASPAMAQNMTIPSGPLSRQCRRWRTTLLRLRRPPIPIT